MKSCWIAGAAISIVAAIFAVSLTSESAWAQSTPLHPAGSILLRLAPKPSVTLVACRGEPGRAACSHARITD